MLEQLNASVGHWEPLWLIVGIFGEMILTLVGMVFSSLYIAKRISEKRTYTKRKKEDTFECLTKGEMK